MDELAVAGERSGDEDAIHIVNCRAFHSSDEGQIVVPQTESDKRWH